MATQVTIGGLPLSQPYDWTVTEVDGWFDSPSLRTSYTPRPVAAGSFFTPAPMDARTIAVTGRVAAPDRRTLIKRKRMLSGLCIDPNQLFPFQVDDSDTDSLVTMVQRSSDVIFKPVNTLVEDYTVSFTAPDPRLLALRPSAAFTQMAQPGAGGAQWNGVQSPSGSSNPNFAADTSAWSGTGSATVTWQAPGDLDPGAALVTSTQASTPTGIVSSGQFNVTVGKTYSASVNVNPSVALTFTLTITWQNSVGSTISTTVLAAPGADVPGVWTNHSVTGVAPATATAATLTVAGGVMGIGQFFAADNLVTLLPGTQWNGPTGTTGLVYGEPTDTGTLVADNSDGNAPADVLLTITGPALNPKVTTVFGVLQYMGDLAANDTLTINTGTGAVLLNGANRRQLLSQVGFFQIPAFSTLAIQFSSDLENADAILAVQWFVSYV